MKLQAKFQLSTAVGVLTVLVVTEGIRQGRTAQTLAELSETSLKRLEASTQGNLEQQHQSVPHQRVAESSGVSKTIARDIGDVSAVVEDIRRGGRQVSESASGLSRLAAQLQVQVTRFDVSRDGGAQISG